MIESLNKTQLTMLNIQFTILPNKKLNFRLKKYNNTQTVYK